MFIESHFMTFRVKAVVLPSQISGLGVFATAPIPAGTVVWQFDDGVDWYVTDEVMKSHAEQMDWFAFRHLGTGRKVMCSDHGNFMNSSTSPTCVDRAIGGVHQTVAARDIEAGEELTVDYAQYGPEYNVKLL